MTKILIIDDDFAITKFLKLAIEKAGTYEVHTENEATLAISKIRSVRPDIILLDVNMPNVSGGEILAQIEEDPEISGSKIIFLTGSVSADEVEQGLSIGGHPALSKPINFMKLMGLLGQLLK